MEQDQIQGEMPSYWPSVAIGGFIVAIIATVASTAFMYYLTGLEPGMGVMIQSGVVGLLPCILGLVGGIIATRHYAKTNEITFSIGKGALIGLLTGAVAAIITTILGQIWQVIDPSLTDNFLDLMAQSFEAMDMPEAQYNEAIEGLEKSKAEQQSVVGILKALGMSLLGFGITNAITGMIGAKIFASPKED